MGCITTAQGGELLTKAYGMPVSATTVLRSLRLLPMPPIERVHVVSLDEWAWKRGRRYGTIIVDLEHHQVLDLLAEHSKEAAQAWLQKHPGIEIVGRDRGGTYADAATWGAPLATQVADRWHLCKNVGDAVETFLVRTRARIPARPAAPAPEAADHVAVAMSETQPRLTGREQQAEARAARRQARFEQVHQLSAQGMGVRAIGRALGLDRKTVRKYLNAQEGLHYAPRPKRRSLLDPYADYLMKRWQAGCENAARLFREIEVQGYRGSATTVRDFVARLRQQSLKRTGSHQHPIASSPRQLRWLLARDYEELGQEEREDLQRLLDTSAEMQQIYALLPPFLRMVRQREPERLRPWMEEAESLGIPELKSFVAGLERDYDAVKAALRLPWSQGVTEGFINKLKTLKRMMYGRAGFELLRRHMLLAA